MIAEKIKNDFINAVKKQEALYRELKEALNQEEKALSNKELGSLDSIILREEELLKKVESSEAEKKSALDALVAAAGLPVGSDVRDVIAQIGAEGAAIEKALIGLIEAVKPVHAVNSKNAHVLKNFLDYTGFIKEAKEKMGNPGTTTYNSKGYKKEEKPVHSVANIDKKI